MVALAGKTDFSFEAPLREHAQNHRCKSRVSSCSKSSKQGNLRAANYDEFSQLESCSKDPIGFQAGSPSLFGYVRSSPINLVDPASLEGLEVIPNVIGLTIGARQQARVARWIGHGALTDQ